MAQRRSPHHFQAVLDGSLELAGQEDPTSPRERPPMKVVVLGASGNAGTALLRALEAEPGVEEVVAVARRRRDRWDSPRRSGAR